MMTFSEALEQYLTARDVLNDPDLPEGVRGYQARQAAREDMEAAAERMDQLAPRPQDV